MNEIKDKPIHWSFWIISIFAFLWNIGGTLNFFMQMNTDLVAKMPETHQAIIDARPIWATGGFAGSVFCGAFGGLFLLLRKPIVLHLFIASLLGTIVTMIHTVAVARFKIELNLIEIMMMIAMPILVGVFVVWYSWLVKIKGWLG